MKRSAPAVKSKSAAKRAKLEQERHLRVQDRITERKKKREDNVKMKEDMLQNWKNDPEGVKEAFGFTQKWNAHDLCFRWNPFVRQKILSIPLCALRASLNQPQANSALDIKESFVSCTSIASVSTKKGWKLTSFDGKCTYRAKQTDQILYEEGKEYKQSEIPQPGRSGFHFCEQPLHCLRFASQLIAPYKLFEIEANGTITRKGEIDLWATNSMKIVRQIPDVEAATMLSGIIRNGDWVETFLNGRLHDNDAGGQAARVNTKNGRYERYRIGQPYLDHNGEPQAVKMSILRDSFIWKTSFSQKEKAFPHQKDTFVASQKEAFAASQKEAFASVSKKDDSDSESENPIKQSAIDGSHNKPPQQKWTKQFVHWGTQEGMNSMLWMDWDDDTLQNVSEKIRKARVNRSLNQPVGFEVMASFGDNPRHVVFDASGGLKYAAF